jgi:uncharacterized protein YrzB (UPF0473 family)
MKIKKTITMIKTLVHFGNVSVNDTPEKSLCEYLQNVPEHPQESVGLISKLMYDTCPAVFAGRSNEIEQLNKFINDARPLLWWAITGSAGKGKTRLAYEFIKELNEDSKWIARIINWNSFFNDFKKNDLCINENCKNMLIVIDYVFAYEKEIAQWIEWLSTNIIRKKKIRVLLIEREDQKIDLSGRVKRAPWEELFSSVPQDLMLMRRLKYDEKNLNLNESKISKECAKEIVISYCSKRDIHIAEGKIDNIIMMAQKSSNNKVSPLQLLLLTEYYATAHGSSFSTNIYQLALENMVNKEVVSLRRIFGITIEEQDIFDFVLLFATIIGKVSMKSYLFSSSIFIDMSLLESTIKKIRLSQMCERDINGEYYICGIQPDLIGEYFVYTILTSLSDEKIKCILENISDKYQHELSRFLLRFIEDNKNYVLDNKKLHLFKDYLPEQNLTFTVYTDAGIQVECEVLFTYESEQTGKNYIAYTDNTTDNEGNTKIYASIYDSNVDKTKLLPIQTDDEWKLIEAILKELQEEIDDSELEQETTALSDRIVEKFKGL